MIKHFVIGLIGLLLSGQLAISAETSIGSIKTVQYSASINRGGNMIPAQEGAKIFAGDTLFTDQTGTIGVIFRDDAMVSLGPNSQVKIDEFLFQPAQGQFAFITRLIQGTAAFVSGQIAKLAPESMKIHTPVAEIGVRGTRFAVQAEGD